MNGEDQKHLEALVSQALRDLPPQPAPASLEARVLQAVARRQALPWWRKSFLHWPRPVQLLFLTLMSALAGAVLILSLRILGTSMAEAWSVPALADSVLAWLASLRQTTHALWSVSTEMLPISPVWIYVLAGAGAALYLILFAVGATAYRALWRAR